MRVFEYVALDQPDRRKEVLIYDVCEDGVDLVIGDKHDAQAIFVPREQVREIVQWLKEWEEEYA